MRHFIILFFGIFFLLLNTFLFGQGNPSSSCDPCQPLGYELIENGDFENGNIVFDSDFIPTCNCDPGTICIGENPDVANCMNPPLNPTFSPTLNNYLIVTGTTTDNILWKNQGNINALQNEEYIFSFAVFPNLDGGNSLPVFNVFINGNLVGTNILSAPNQWSEVCVPWFSTDFQDVSIEIIQVGANNTPAYYGIDDISFERVLQEARACELIVQYEPNVSESYKDSLKAIYGVTTESICPCGDIERWFAGQYPIYTPDGRIIFDLEGLKKGSKDQPGIQSVDYNYNTKNPDIINDNGGIDLLPPGDMVDDTCFVTVAVIDSGLDRCHHLLNDNLWCNCNACPTDGGNGYNMAYGNNNFYDDSYNGHGTHVAGIVKSYFDAYNTNPSSGVKIMPVKAVDSLGFGSLYDIICATSYAVENGADVINMSFGYRGDSTTIFYNTIKNANDINNIVVVASVGNDNKDNDLYGHYPSNHSNPNLIAVAADTAETQLSSYSSFGATTVDLSVNGRIESSIPIALDINDGCSDGFTFMTGTSMAAPQISAAAAIAKQYMADPVTVKSSIINTSIPLPITIKPTKSNRSFDFINFQSSLENETLCPGCCSVENSCSTACALPDCGKDCTFPCNIQVDLGTNPNSVSVSWAPVYNVQKYQVRYRRALTSSWTNSIANSPNKIINGLTQNKVYDLRIRSQCEDGTWSDMSTIQKFRTVQCLAPLNIVSTQLPNNKVRVEWENYANADKYQIWYREVGAGEDWSKAVTYFEGMNYRVLNNLSPNSTYEYKVRSFCENSYGPFSPTLNFTNAATRLSIDNTEQGVSDIQLYPNPTSKIIFIDFINQKESQSIEIQINNALGKVVYSNNNKYPLGVQKHAISIEHLEKGYYFLVLNDGKNIITKRFIKS